MLYRLVKFEVYKIMTQAVVWFVSGCSIVLFLIINAMIKTDNFWAAIATFPYMEGSLLQVSIILAALPATFSKEYESKMDALLLSSKFGKKVAVIAKLYAAMLFASLVVLLSWILAICSQLLFAASSDPYAAIQTLANHEQAPFSFTLWQYSLIAFLTNWVGLIAFSMFMLYISVHTRHYTVSYFIGGMLWILSFFIRNFSIFSIEWILKNMTFIDIIRVQNIFNRDRYLFIGSSSFSLPVFVFYSYTLIAIALFGLGCYHHFRRRQIFV